MSVGVEQVLLYVQAGLLFASLPLSTVAAYGFRGTPWGRVLAVLPPMELAFVVGTGLLLAEVDAGPWLVVQTVAYGVAISLVGLLAFRLARLARGGVQA